MMNAHRAIEDQYLRDAFRTSIENHRKCSEAASFNITHFFFYSHDERIQNDLAEEIINHRDIVQGDFLENTNDGKTLELFRVTSQMSGDFVIKVEADTTVKWSHLLKIAGLQAPVYFGEAVNSVKHGLPIAACDTCPSNCTSHPSSGQCRFFMAGPMYGLSMDAVRAVAACRWAWAHRRGREDVMVADWLAHCVHGPSVRAVHFGQGELHRHGNSRGHTEYIAYNIITQRLRPYGARRPKVAVARKVVLVGIMSNAHTAGRDRYIRDAFRTSIANFRRRAPEAPFELSHFFFFGRAEGADLAEENRTHGDIVQGDFPENMNDGKTFELLNYSSRMRGDFVVKLDDDTTVRWSRLELVASLQAPVFFGSIILLKTSDHFPFGVFGPSTECQCLPDLPCEPGQTRPALCYYRIAGPMYGLSMDVVRGIAACESARRPRHDHEDVIVSQWLRACGLQEALHSAHFPEGLIHRHGNKPRLNGDNATRVEFNIITERVNAPHYDRSWRNYVVGGGGPFPAPPDSD